MAYYGNEGCSGKFFSGLLMGSTLGLVAGILFAPKSGRELRADLKEKGKPTFDQAKRQMEEIGEKGREVIEQAKSQMGKAQGTA